ncbi:MAG: acylphosphatase [Ignavibacteriales bacterium]|nr:MAG: acylphosphatase [Ignavibacteriaceae bacterium]MBW7872623.1 acylphosphatase [Ignavibacteria bacterium]MCZ2141823.1 acylphosphatase [Ignavibacteriales bacterium]MBV6444991.1 Acylphosphatase [Ignavibacteriaceae bacterium]MBZ0196676.1 acylphosphatase [Ignavibacteriaceae bacterium]
MAARVEIVVQGLVQGVGFRWFIFREAKELGLTGYVKNTRSGSVEIVAEGEEWQIEELVNAAKRGPTRSHVSAIKVERGPANNEFNKFEIRH